MAPPRDGRWHSVRGGVTPVPHDPSLRRVVITGFSLSGQRMGFSFYLDPRDPHSLKYHLDKLCREERFDLA